MEDLIHFSLISLVSASIVGVILGFLIKRIVESAPAKMASDPKLLDLVGRAVDDLSSGRTISLEELPGAVKQWRQK